MAIFNTQPVIDLLSELSGSFQLNAEQIDEAIDSLERIKSNIDIDDDESIDKVDEIQDYLQYLLVVKEPLLEEVKEELSQMINELRQ